MQRSNSILSIYAMPWPVSVPACTPSVHPVVDPQTSVPKALFPLPPDPFKEDARICKYMKERYKRNQKANRYLFL
jgi:hypothetical protein